MNVPQPAYSRLKLFALLASLWLFMVGVLLWSSYHSAKQDAFYRLGFKTDAAVVEMTRHWPALQHESQQEQKDYLHQLSQRFRPRVHFTLIAQNGRLVQSTLNNLDQLSYSPALRQIRAQQAQGQNCLAQLSGLQLQPVHACFEHYPQHQLFLISSLHQQDFLQFWLQQAGDVVATVMLGLLIFSILFYLLSQRHTKNLSRQHQLSGDLKKQGNDFKRLISNLPGLVYRIDVQQEKIDYISPGSLQLLGYPPEHFLQQQISPFDLIDDQDKARFKRQSRGAHFSMEPFELIYRVSTLQGDVKWILDRGRCYQDANDRHCVEGVMLDITERELVRQQIEYLAIQDPLTELYNRYKFNDELVNAVDLSNRHEHQFAMLFIDLDRFKNINDSLGHQLGDRLLRKVASRLQAMLDSQHFLARMGGDEFVILMHNVSQLKEVETLAQDINRTLRQPFTIDNYQLRTSCSIGISLCPGHSSQSHILWRYADTAMYQVKSSGGDGFKFFTTEMGDRVQHRITIEHGFVPALENQQFDLYYQPQVDMDTGKVSGAEALIRWHHPELGFISPAEFIPIAEETGFIHDLGDWILHQALSQLSKWQQINPKIHLAVNVSAVQLTEEFPQKLAELIQQYKIQPHTLELEITESLLMENIDFVQPMLNRVCKQDVHLAIDDFGTGYSSLSYLRYLPIDKLKIDRAFVMNIEDNQDDVGLVKAIIAMAKNLNLQVLAEGIETQLQFGILKELGCEAFQGYLFNQPIDKNRFYSLYIDTQQTVQSNT